MVSRLAYRGKQGCESPMCTRLAPGLPDRSGLGLDKSCYGWHCGDCDQPSSMQGHFGKCPTEIKEVQWER